MSRIQTKERERQKVFNQARRKILNLEKTITKGSFKDIPYGDIALWHKTAGVIDDMMDQNNTIVAGEVYVNNLSDLPSAALHPGKVIYVLGFGVGGSPWISNGVIWVPAAGSIVVANFYNPVVLGGTVTTEQILRQVVFPTIPNQGSCIRIGDIICVTFDYRKTGTTNAYTTGYRFGILGTLTDPFFETPTGAGATTIATTGRNYLCRLDATNFKKIGIVGYSSFAGITSQADGGNLVIANADTNNLTLSHTAKLNGSTDTFTNRTFMVELISSGASS